MQDYYNQFVRYEPRGEIGNLTSVRPVRVRKEILNGKLTVVRVTECRFPNTESHYLSSIELDGWGSCSVKGLWFIPPTREQLIAIEYLKPAGHGQPTLELDWRAWKSHRRDQELMMRGQEPELPAGVVQCDCGVCNECAGRLASMQD